MGSQDIRNLQEAYLEVYNELGEGFKEFPSKKVYKQAGRKLDKKPKGRGFDHTDIEVDHMMDTRANFRNKDYDFKGDSIAASAANRNRPKSEKRSKTISDNSPKKSFPNRLRRSDGQGIRDSYDYYDIILSHLLDEGYAETPESAEVIMVNMSEEWRESIMEGIGGAKDQEDYWKRHKERNERENDELEKIKKRQNQRQKEQQAQEFLKKHPKK